MLTPALLDVALLVPRKNVPRLVAMAPPLLLIS